MLNDRGRDLPELFRPGESAESWPERRAELRRILETNIYGAFPIGTPEIFVTPVSEDSRAFAGKANGR